MDAKNLDLAELARDEMENALSVGLAPRPVVEQHRAPTSRPTAVVTIKATVDGSEIITINQDCATWKDDCWDWPHHVSLNGVSWDPQTDTTLPNSGSTKFLPFQADFAKTRIARSGRDIVAIQLIDDGVQLSFIDSPNGSDDYSATLVFEAAQPSTHDTRQ